MQTRLGQLNIQVYLEDKNVIEFLAAASDTKVLLSEANIKAAFDMFDNV